MGHLFGTLKTTGSYTISFGIGLEGGGAEKLYVLYTCETVDNYG